MEKTTKPKLNFSEIYSKRYFQVDFIRGLCILLVMIDHTFFDVTLFGRAWLPLSQPFLTGLYRFGFFYLGHPARIAIRFLVLAIFFALSGFSSSFSRNNLKRGVKTLVVAYALTIGSYVLTSFAGSNFIIDFNAIHVYGFSILIYYFLRKKSASTLLIIGGLSLVAPLLIEGVTSLLPFSITTKLFLPLGITPVGYIYGDYLALVPYLGFFLIGVVLSRSMLEGESPHLKISTPKKAMKPLLFLGRHSIFFYFGHQVVAFALFTLLNFLLFL